MKPSLPPLKLGVNIDHVATLRQQRGTPYPSPVQAALMAETAGADSITLHLREDRRHIQDADVEILRRCLQTKMNLEMAVTEEMLGIACRLQPQDVCLVPEKRQELTTEGGLDVVGNFERVKAACLRLGGEGMRVSLFIGHEREQIDAAKAAGAPVIEIHTGQYAEATHPEEQAEELHKIIIGAEYAAALGLIVNAGHGLHYHNVQAVAAIPMMNELNIGHGIVAQALFTGWERAVADMKALMQAARGF